MIDGSSFSLSFLLVVGRRRKSGRKGGYSAPS
jgi:hypothetical protein